MNINLTEQEIKFLKDFASKQYDGAEDNICTHTPIHVVENRVSIIVDPEYNYDAIEYIFNEVVFKTFEELRDSVLKYIIDNYSDSLNTIDNIDSDDTEVAIETLGNIFKNIKDYDYLNYWLTINDFDDVEIHEHFIKYIWQPIAFFFIRDEAKRYLQYQKHNLNNPRIYTYALGYSNHGDMPVFRELLMKLGQKLLKEEKK